MCKKLFFGRDSNPGYVQLEATALQISLTPKQRKKSKFCGSNLTPNNFSKCTDTHKILEFQVILKKVWREQELNPGPGCSELTMYEARPDECGLIRTPNQANFSC